MHDEYASATRSATEEIRAAEEQIISAAWLMEELTESVFRERSCAGMLRDYAERTDGDLDKAARLWMQEHFDHVHGICCAVKILLTTARDTLVNLTVVPCSADNRREDAENGRQR